MRPILVAALCGLALAASYSNRRIDAKSFAPEKEYTFEWESQLASGLPVDGSQHSTQRISSKVHLQFRDRSAFLQLSSVNFFVTQETLRNPSRLAPISSFEPVEPSNEQTKFMSLPVRFQYENGRVSDLEFDSSDPAWSQNIKRAVINMLQVNMKQSEASRTDETEENLRIKETTLEGQCDVIYARGEETKKWQEERRDEEEILVTKSIDFSKCDRRPDVIYSYGLHDECRECDDHLNKLYKDTEDYQSSTVMRFRISGSQSNFLINRVELSSKYIFSPINDNQPIINNEVVAQLVLIESGEMKTQMPSISSRSKTTLVHSNQLGLARERWEMTGDEKALEVYKMIGDYEEIEAAKKTLDELNSMTKEGKSLEIESSHMFARLISILRRCTYTQLDKIHRYANELDENLSTICVDAIAEAGTKVCLDYITKLIVNDEITPIRAAYLLKTLSTMRLPSSVIIEDLDRLAKETVSEKNPILKQSIRLTQGVLIHTLCVPNRSQWAHSRDEVCSREVLEKMVDLLEKMYKKASTRYEKTLALKTIANAGLEKNVLFLEKIIHDKTEEPTIRMQAMDAFRLIRTEIPRRIQKTLMPVYKSRSQPTEVRVTAVFHLLHTMPERMVLEQIVDQINNERNGQVAAYSYRILKSFAQSVNPCEKEFAERCKIALRLIKEETKARFEKLSSTYKQASIYSEMLLSSGSIEFSSVFGNDSVLPKEVMASIDGLFAGYWNKHFLQMGVVQQGLDRVFRENLPKVESIKSIDDVITRGKRSIFDQPKQILQDLFKKLSIVGRGASDETERDPHAIIYLRYRNMDYALIPLDEEVVTKLMRNVLSGDKLNLEEIEKYLIRGVDLKIKTASMISEITRIYPTTFGTPMMLSTKMPMVSSIRLQAKAELLPKGETYLNGIKMELTGEPSTTITQLCQSMVLSPIVHTGIKLQNSILAILPVDASIQIEYRNKELLMETTFKVPREDKLLFKALTRPVTYIRKVSGEKNRYIEAIEKSIYVPRFERMNKEIDMVYGEELLGMGFHVIGNLYTQFDNKEILPIIANEKHMEIRALSKDRIPTEYRVRSSMNLFKDMSLPSSSVFESFFDEENREHFAVEQDSSENFEETEREELHKKNSRNFNKEQGIGHSAKITIETIGGRKEKKAELLAQAVCDKDSLRMCHFEIDIRRNPMKRDGEPCKAKLNLYTLFPQEVSSLEELKERKHREFHSVLQASFGCERTNEVTLKLQAEQNKEMRKWISYVPKAKGVDVDNFKMLKEAGYLNQYKIDAEYNMDKKYENLISQGYRLLRSWNYWKAEFETLSGPSNRVSALIEIEPENRRYFNLSIKTSETKMSLKSVRVPYKLPLLNILHPVELRSYKAHEYTRSVCEIRSNKIRSFDDVLFKTPITTCYSLVAKDCSNEEPSFAVLVKKLSKNGEEKKIKVLNKEKKIEMWMEDENIIIQVNGKRVKDESISKHDIVKITDQSYRIELEELSVRFDGRVVRVELSQQYKGRQCGLCGHYDDDRENEFRRADNEHTEDLEEFHRSYLSRDEECEIEETKMSEKKNYGRVEESSSEELSILDEIDLTKALSDDDDLIERQQVIEYTHRTCFSRTPIKECPRGEPVRSEKTTLRFVCFPRDSKEALRFIREVRRGPIDVDSYPDAFTQSIKTAIQCRA